MGALSGNRLRPNSVCSIPPSLWETRLTRGCRTERPLAEEDVSNRRVRNTWRNPEPFAVSSPSDPQGRTNERPPTKLAEPLTQPSAPSAYDGPSPPLGSKAVCPSTERLSVSPRSQTGTIIRVRQQTVGGQTAYRAAAKVSTGTESKPQRDGPTRPPVRPGEDGAEGGRGVGSHDRRARQAPCPDDRTPVRGHADFPYLQGPSGGPPAIVAPGSPAARLAPAALGVETWGSDQRRGEREACTVASPL